MDKNTICYTGVGALKSGNHTKKQYLKIMNKIFREECSQYIKSLKCKSCKKKKQLWNRELKKYSNAQSKNKTYKIPKKTEQEIQKQDKLCDKCKNKNNEKCNVNNYILFSGAKIGKCEKTM